HLERLPAHAARRRALARADEQALALVVALDVELQFLADLRRLAVEELHERYDPLALAAEVDEGVVLADRHDPPQPEPLLRHVPRRRPAGRAALPRCRPPALGTCAR